MTPQEMEEMTAAWAPYRSIACWCVRGPVGSIHEKLTR